jgi:hypothetical protein
MVVQSKIIYHRRHFLCVSDDLLLSLVVKTTNFFLRAVPLKMGEPWRTARKCSQEMAENRGFEVRAVAPRFT